MDVSHVQVEIRNAYKIYVGIQMTRDIRNIQGKKNRKHLYASFEALLDVSSKGKVSRRLRKPREGVEEQLYSVFNLSARMRSVVKATPRPLYPRERSGTHCKGGWVGPRAGLEGCEKFASTGIRSPARPNRRGYENNRVRSKASKFH